MTDDGFGTLMCQKCAQSQIRLGEWGGGGGYHWGGGSANREPGSYIYIYIYIYIWCRIAASQAPPPPSQASPPSKQSHVIRVTPAQARPFALARRVAGLPTTHGTTRQGTTGAGWGRVTHNTRNHRAPSPSPPLRHTDENDGDDVVHNDVDVLFPAWLLVVPLLLCCSGLRHCMFIACLVESRAWLGIMTTILVVIIIIITIILITTIGFGAQGRSEFSGTVSHPQVQSLSNRTPNQQQPWKGAQPTATTGRRGEPTPQGTTGGEGGYHGVGGEGGPSSAAPYMCIHISIYI